MPKPSLAKPLRLETNNGSKFIVRQRIGRSVVLVECPHCEEDIELPDKAEGLFECPHCDEEFEWGRQSSQVHDGRIQSRDFWIGLIVPFLATVCGVVLSFILVGDSWDVLLWVFLSILLCPILALGILIYGYMNKRNLLWIGASVAFVISALVCLLLILGGL